MDLTALQKAAAQAIVNIFETGSIRGNYGDVTLMRGDTGELTYGRSQTTLASGNLFLLIQAYAARSDGLYSAQMKPYLPALEDCNSALDTDMAFRGLLVDAGDDPVMRAVQDAFFDKVYWDPAMRSADALGAQTPLGAAIVYDSTVHGSFAHVRELTRAAFGELSAIGEKAWMTHYVEERRNWLATHPNALLHKTVYRMDAFREIVADANWDLALAFAVRGLSISEDALAGAAPVKAPADAAPRRLLRLKSPPLSGADVTWLQGRLARAGIALDANAVFDKATDQAVRAFQAQHSLSVDGVVGPATRAALEDLAVTAPARAPAQDVPMPAVAPPPSRPLPAIAPAPAPVAKQDSKPAAKKIDAKKADPRKPAAPAPSSGDPVADLKQHITDQVQAGIDDVKQSVNAQQARLVQALMSGDLKGGLADIATGLKNPSFFARLFTNGRAILAATLSALTLAFTESRDLLSWSNAASNAPAPVIAAAKSAADAGGAAHDVYDRLSQARDMATQAYVSLHNFAATVPNDWIFRLRIAALTLIAYAVFRLTRKKAPAKPPGK